MRLTFALGPLRLAVSTDRDTDAEIVDLTESSEGQRLLAGRWHDRLDADGRWAHGRVRRAGAGGLNSRRAARSGHPASEEVHRRPARAQVRVTPASRLRTRLRRAYRSSATRRTDVRFGVWLFLALFVAVALLPLYR